MNIWVDADACPAVTKDIIFRAAERTKLKTTLVANHSMHIPKIANIQFLQVQKGFDIADDEIVKRIQVGDLVITSDIPLAAEAIEKGGQALSPRGELFTTSNIKARLNMRDFFETLRASGIQTGGPDKMSQADRQQFANHLDAILQKYIAKKQSS